MLIQMNRLAFGSNRQAWGSSRRHGPQKAGHRSHATDAGGLQPLSHPTLEGKPAEGRQWIHEIKFDGWRIQLNVRAGQVTWWSRNGNDLTDRLPRPTADIAGSRTAFWMVSSARSVRTGSRTSRAKGSGKLVYYAFDIMWRGTTDLRPYALSTRKMALAQVIAKR